jgi:hypothetical protein
VPFHHRNQRQRGDSPADHEGEPEQHGLLDPSHAQYLAPGDPGEAEDAEFPAPGQGSHGEGVERRDDHVHEKHDHTDVDRPGVLGDLHVHGSLVVARRRDLGSGV